MSILTALVKAYDRLPDPPRLGYSSEKISFVISLNDDGSVAGVSDLRDVSGKKPQPRMMTVPAAFKRSGTTPRPFFLWDKTAFSLGVTAVEGRSAAGQFKAFRDYHLERLADSRDVGLAALRKFLFAWSPDAYVSPFWPEEMKDANVVFALENERQQGIYLHNRPAAEAMVIDGAGAALSGSGAICLVTGERGPTARLHPAIKNVWGGQSAGGSIVAFNLDAFESYGHSLGENAPVSESAAFKYTTALNSLLGGRTNRLQIGDASTVFWADASDAQSASMVDSVFGSLFSDIDEATEAGKVGAILKRIRSGTVWEEAVRDIAPELAQGVRFHVLGLAPNAARISIRFWFENDFGVLAENYQRFVADMAIEPQPRGGYPPLWRYLNETAVLGKRENVPPNLAGEWMRAILEGTRYPLTLLSSVLGRIRADGDVNALRAGMLRALLVRNYGMDVGRQKDKSKEAPVALDPENTNKGYLLGRLVAVYEQAQTAALGRNVNSTIKDKFYGSASASPRRVFALLEKGAANHLSKVGKQRPGQRVNLERMIGGILEVMSPDDDPFPTSLPAEDQALFGLGYYHQRGEFFRKPEIAGTEDATS